MNTAVADSVRASSPEGIFHDLFANRVDASFAPIINGIGLIAFAPPIIDDANLPVFPFVPGRALTDNAADLQVGGSGVPSPFTFTPGIPYRDVRLNNDAVVNFGDGTSDLRSLEIGRHVTITVTDQTILQIIDQPGHESRAQRRDPRPVLLADGWLDMGGRNQLFGRYIARRITGDPNNNVTLELPPLQPPGGAAFDPFQCYEIHRTNLDRTVTLENALGTGTVLVERAKRICAPAVTLNLSRPDRLLVPTAKSVVGPPRHSRTP